MHALPRRAVQHLRRHQLSPPQVRQNTDRRYQRFQFRSCATDDIGDLDAASRSGELAADIRDLRRDLQCVAGGGGTEVGVSRLHRPALASCPVTPDKFTPWPRVVL